MSDSGQTSSRAKNVIIDDTVVNRLRKRGYNLLDKIGEGSYGTVYLTEYKKPGGDSNSTESIELLACKIIDTKLVAKEYTEKFLPRELDIIERIIHPHIIEVHSIYQKDSQYFIFLRYAVHGDLLSFIMKNGPLSENLTFKWFQQLNNAINYLHGLDIAHRDLKCENLLISERLNIKVSDFGFARSVLDKGGKHTQSETYCGSISYAPPEILIGDPYDPKRADMWAMGVILYVMLNKALPFYEKTVKEIYDKQTQRAWYFRKKVFEVTSNEVKELIVNLLNPNPKVRMMTGDILVSRWFHKNIHGSSLMTMYDTAETESGTPTDHWIRYSETIALNPPENEGSMHILTRDKKRTSIVLRKGLR